jgi:hypothetical protein
MSSGYFASDEAWWVSNGSAELLDASWARHIRALGNQDSPGGAELLALLDKLVEMSATGMLGFAFDEDVPIEARPILRTAIADFAREFVAAVEGEVRHESLAFVAHLEPRWVAWWVATHYALYEMLGTAMGEPHTLDLDVAPDLDAAARGTRVAWPLWRFKREPDPPRELAVRRVQADAWRAAGHWVSSSERTGALYELADLEERLGNYEESAALTEEAAALETDAAARAVAMEMAAHRRGL